jgi:hypothetical protein
VIVGTSPSRPHVTITGISAGYTARRAKVIFDHPYNCRSVCVEPSGSWRPPGAHGQATRHNRAMGSSGTEAWRYRSWFTAVLVFWQGLVCGLLGVALALPFGDPAPPWAFWGAALVGAAWAAPAGLTLDGSTLSVRNALRRHRVPLEDIAAIQAKDWISGWGRSVQLRTADGRRIRVSALGGDDGSATKVLNELVRTRRGF